MILKKTLPLLMVFGMLLLMPIKTEAASIKTLQGHVKKLQTQLTTVNNEIKQLNIKIDKAGKSITSLEKELKIKQNEKKQLLTAIETRTLHLEELKDKTEYDDLLADSENKEDILEKMSDLQEMIDSDTVKVNNTHKVINHLDGKKTMVKKQKNTYHVKRKKAKVKKAKITKKIKYKKSQIKKYKKLQTNWNGPKLTRSKGINHGPSGKETYYNLPMGGVVRAMRSKGFNGKYWVRSDGCKMLGDYIMVAANLKIRPRGSKVKTSLGMGLVCDTGTFAGGNPRQLDIAVNW